MGRMGRASSNKACRRALAAGIIAGIAGHAQADPGTAEVLRHSCAQPSPDRVECDYRLSIPGRSPTVMAKISDLELPPPLHLPYPYDQSVTAVLVVIDAEVLERPDSANRIPAHIERILAAVKPHHRIGVATFAAQPRIALPLGASTEDIVTAVQTLAREPSPAALSQDAMAAVRTLALSPAARKAILFFGDESANPDAYYHAKLIAAARDAQVQIFGIVYPSTEPMAPALTALGQLASESGGELVAARPPGYELPEAFASDPFAAIDSGGRLSIDLTPAVNARLTGPKTLILNVVAGEQTVDIEVPVNIGPALPAAPSPPRADEGTVGVARGDIPPWVWLAGLSAALLVLSGILFVRTQRRRAADAPDTGPPAVRAYLTRSDGEAGRFIVAKTPCRIGRGRDNELMLRDNSVSRHHAEIVRDDRGRFAIKDLDSLNGVFVDNKKIQWTPLGEGAQIDIGDLRLVFSTGDAPVPHELEPEGGVATEARLGS